MARGLNPRRNSLVSRQLALREKLKAIKRLRSCDPDMDPVYDFRGGERGKYASRYAEGTNLVVLSPDVAKAFPNSESVNEALRQLMTIGQGRAGRSASGLPEDPHE